MEGPLTVLEDLSERLHYNLDDFPVYTKKDELYRYGYKALCHYHPDLEFIYIVEGTMDYFINGKLVRLEKGQGIFVNSLRLHYGFSDEHFECTFIALVIHPRIFIEISHAGKDYYEKKFGYENIDYLVLYPHVSWHKELIDQILLTHDHLIHMNVSPLKLLCDAIEVIDRIGSHIDDHKQELQDHKEQMEFLKMTEYIHTNFGERISIDDIAASGTVCRAKACQLFKKFVKTSPNNYLNSYRIIKATELLRDTNLDIIEISNYCGFTTSSYFASVFKKETGKTPVTYRKEAKKLEKKNENELTKKENNVIVTLL